MLLNHYRSSQTFIDRIIASLGKKGRVLRITNKEQGLLVFFALLVFVLLAKLFFLQVVSGSWYRKELSLQHSSRTDIIPERGSIFMYDDAGHAIPLATNADTYTLFADPKFVWDSERSAVILAPFLYEHFCTIHELDTVSKEGCIKNIEQFTRTPILPTLHTLYYSLESVQTGVSLGSGIIDAQIAVEEKNKTIIEEKERIVSSFTREEGVHRIQEQLIVLLTPGKKKVNYLGYFDSPALLEALSGANLPYLRIDNTYYISLIPDVVTSRFSEKEANRLSDILTSYGYMYTADRIKPLFSLQDTRYVKVTDRINATIAQKIMQAKTENYSIKNDCDTNESCEGGIPLLHAIGLEKTNKRYYPLGNFAANVLGYITQQGQSLYGIEQYFDSLLKGTPGQIKGLSTPWIGQVGSNNISIIKPIDGGDVYLTIHPTIQRKTENIITHYVQEFNADSIAVLIMDPFSGNIIASANAPTFNPNDPQDSYALMPLTPEYAYIVEDDTRVDIPVYYVTGNALQIATYEERKDQSLNKYIAKNFLGAQVFVDKNIAFPYEPGSIIKPFTVAAGIDNDEISLYDFYQDPEGQVTIDLGDGQKQFIRNADKVHCPGTHTFLHALVYSCNVGMVRIAQQIKKQAFFNYMERFGFGIPTNIELAGEDPGYLDSASNAGLARFFNNSFGQGMLSTPIQIAAGYSSLVNGGYYVKPRIIDKTYDPVTKTFIQNPVRIGAQILKPETSEKIKEALFEVVYGGLTKKFGIPGYTLGGKTGTPQISFKGVYKSGNGWTNGSFVGMITKENLKYVVVIQVRRPRTNQYGEYTAGKIFGDLAKMIIEKDLITK